MKLIRFSKNYLILNIWLFIFTCKCYSQSTKDFSDAYIYIDFDPTIKIVLAEPHTLPSNKEINITIYSTLTPLNYEITFVWIITPQNNERFIETEGYGTITHEKNKTQVTISTKDTSNVQWEISSFTFQLDKILLTNSSNLIANNTLTINPMAKSIPIYYLPTNFPFGLFEFTPFIPSNFSVSRYSQISYADSIQIIRKFGRNYRILLTYEEIEFSHRRDSSEVLVKNRSIKYLEFLNDEFSKFVNFNQVLKNESNLNKYPRFFALNLTHVEILDGEAFRFDDPLIKISTDILPKIGSKSTLFITLIDDRSVVEFLNTNLRININTRYDHVQAILLTLTRSSISSQLNESVIVNFLTVPMYTTLTENGVNKTYYPAKPYHDYTPMSGHFVFKPNSKIATFLFKIMPNDEFYFNNNNKLVKIYLLGIENCENCQLGFNIKSEIYLNWIRYPFRNLLKWSALFFPESSSPTISDIFLDTPIAVSNSIANVSMKVSRLCLVSQTNVPVKVDFDLIRIDEKISENVNVNIVENGQDLYFPKNNSNACLNIGIVFLNDRNQTFYCYNLTGIFLLKLTTRYVIKRNSSIYSSVVSVDSFNLNLVNTNCSRVSFDQSNLNKFWSKESLLVLSEQYDNETNRVEIKLNTDLNYTINIPIHVVNNLGRFSVFQVKYVVEIDTSLENYLRFSTDNPDEQMVISKKHITIHHKRISRYVLSAMLNFTYNSTLSGPSSVPNKAFIKFNLINLSLLKNLYMLNLNISLASYNYCENDYFRQYEIDETPLTWSNLSIYFIIYPASVEESKICGIISLTKQSRFVYLNSKRQLII